MAASSDPGPPPGLNVGELMRSGAALTTREVLALVHEACRNTRDVPQSPDDLWITDSGEVLSTPSDRADEPIDARNSVAALLETMLPSGDDGDPARLVPPSLRSLASRLRGSNATGEQGRRDLMTILRWHIGAEPREIAQTLAHRVRDPQSKHDAAILAAAAADDWGLFSEPEVAPRVVTNDTPAPAAPVPAKATRAQAPVRRKAAPAAAAPVVVTASSSANRKAAVSRGLALIGAGLLLIGVGSASYWLVRDSRPVEESARADTAAAPPSPVRRVEREPSATVPPPSRTEPTPAPPAKPTQSQEPAAPRQEPAPVPPPDAPRDAPLPPIAAPDGAFSPAFTADGRELFFHSGRAQAGRLLVANLEGGGRVVRVNAVIDDGSRDYHPRVSPDGRLIAFDSDRDGERGVYVADRDGTDVRRVSGDGYAAVPSWSPDMKWLAFIRGEPGRPRVWNLWLRDLGSGQLQRHTSFRSGQVWGASWFPDGRTLCYSHETRLFISNLDANAHSVIQSPRPGHLVRTPAVSPDGSRVVFQVFRDGVWLLDVRTRQLRRILDDPTAEEFAWAPDGRRIAYHSRRDGAWKIWMHDVPQVPVDR